MRCRRLPSLLGADPMAVAEVIGDTHYGDSATRRSWPAEGIDLVARPPASAPEGYFSKEAFDIARGGPGGHPGHERV